TWSRSHCSACGAISRSAKSRTTLRKASCSSLRSKSTPQIVGCAVVTLAWVNGELIAADAPGVAAADHGLVVGDGVFETLRVYRGTPFAIRRHLDQLERSADGLGMALPPRSRLEQAMREGVAANAVEQARLRLT